MPSWVVTCDSTLQVPEPQAVTLPTPVVLVEIEAIAWVPARNCMVSLAGLRPLWLSCQFTLSPLIRQTVWVSSEMLSALSSAN